MIKYEKNKNAFYEGVSSIGDGIYSIFSSFADSLSTRPVRNNREIGRSIDKKFEGLDMKNIYSDWRAVGNDFKKAMSYFNFKKK